MTKIQTLFLAWQDASSRRWYPIGRLQNTDDRYRFQYLRGVKDAERASQFQLLPSFPDENRVYESRELFPLFLNRVMPQSRPDFPHYVEWLNLNGDRADPFAFLEKSGGRKATDTLEIFPCAETLADGRQRVHFFVHGLRHMSPDSVERALRLQEEERLLLQWDAQNPQHEDAVSLRTHLLSSGDASMIGYCPRYIAGAVREALNNSRLSCTVTVMKVNLPPAPSQFRVLCRMEIAPEAGVRLFTSEEFQPLTV